MLTTPLCHTLGMTARSFPSAWVPWLGQPSLPRSQRWCLWHGANLRSPQPTSTDSQCAHSPTSPLG
jgi:hypothetical protein